MLRTRTCGELRKENVGEEVVLSGWVSKVRNLGALVFVDLRDRYGFTQINISPELFENNPLKNEYCVQVKGKVSLKDVPNKNLATGEIEVIASEIKVYSSSIVPPFIIADKTDALEDTRLKDRFLDLRRPYLQNNLILRSKIVKSVHEFFDNLGFVEVETPTLVKSTPEGARDYLVPSRIKKGAFYALPQSPQIYKQLLMISGMDRYYQVARCYRDEDLRADRQPEFTQVDVEMSFVEREDVLKVIEDLLNKVFKDTISYDLGKFKRISYKDAIELYGSDKPDMRFDLLLKDISFISSKGFEAYKDKAVKCLVVPSLASQTTRKIMDSDNLEAKKYGIHGVSHLKYENGVLTGSIVKYFAKETIDELVNYLGLKDGDLVIVGADANRTRLSEALGSLRLIYGDKLGLRNKDIYVPLFVIDWPLFDREDGKIVSLSNPFTRPRDEDLPLLDEDPTKVLS
ncbi:MAG: aspartate--tRNA ligase [Bacilli bacterium]|nr:aspartate--tRNA ligase [Bacilli bacterium]